jgi:hypothetical protein
LRDRSGTIDERGSAMAEAGTGGNTARERHAWAASKRRRILAVAAIALVVLMLLPWTRHAVERVLHIHSVPTGSACNQGSGGAAVTGNTMAINATPDGNGYWLLHDDGGIFTYGDAPFYGSAASHIQTYATALALTPSGRGYWIVERRGMVWAYGDAQCYGGTYDTGATDIIGIAPTASGNGYWLIEQDGGIWPYGDAVSHSYGGLGNHSPLLTDIVSMAPTPSGNGYWIVEADGGVWPFGDACGCGSEGGVQLNAPIATVITPPGSAQGYFLVGTDGGVFPFGSASGYLGSWAGRVPGNDVAGAALTLLGHGMYFARGMGQVITLGDGGSYQ